MNSSECVNDVSISVQKIMELDFESTRRTKSYSSDRFMFFSFDESFNAFRVHLKIRYRFFIYPQSVHVLDTIENEIVRDVRRRCGRR